MASMIDHHTSNSWASARCSLGIVPHGLAVNPLRVSVVDDANGGTCRIEFAVITLAA